MAEKDIKADWKSFKEDRGLGKKITIIEKEVLKSHVILSEGFTDYDLVQLVMFYNNKDVDQVYIEKFKANNYINENKKFTKQGLEFLKSEETILKLKKIISEN